MEGIKMKGKTRVRTFPYVGISKEGAREIFRASAGPPEELYGDRYAAIIGPFRTKRGAEFMRDYGKGNPHCQDVNSAERLAKKNASNPTQAEYNRPVNKV